VKQVDRLHCGLAWNTVSGAVDTLHVYPQGRWFIGVNRQFIMFPTTVTTLYFSDSNADDNVQDLSVITCRDMDGKQIKLDITVQYRLKPENVGNLYQSYSTLYQDVFISSLRGALTQSTNTLSISQAWSNYTNVTQILRQACVDALSSHWAECWGLQLWRITLSDGYEQALVQTQTVKQKVRTERAKTVAAITRAQTQVILADYTKNVTIVQANSTAQQLIIHKMAISQADANLITAQSTAITVVQDIVRFNSSCPPMTGSQLVNYQRFMMLDQQKNSQLLLNSASGYMSSMTMPNVR